ncbi:MAG: hypothetical protein ACLQNE_09475 [Thermoguttaceae bacterium]
MTTTVLTAEELKAKLAANKKARHRDDVLGHLPCLTAHLICESLGYFTPQSAANAVAYYTEGEAFYCEWYYDWAGKRFASGNTKCADLRDTIKEVGQLAIQNAFKRRHHHRGSMAEFKRALALVLHVRQGGQGPMFASWF